MNREKFIEGLNSDIAFTDEERTEIYAKSIEHNGAATLLVISMEELAELQQQASKMLRRKGDIIGLVEEMADVIIATTILQCIFGVNAGVLTKAVDVKLNRIKEAAERDEQNDKNPDSGSSVGAE